MFVSVFARESIRPIIRTVLNLTLRTARVLHIVCLATVASMPVNVSAEGDEVEELISEGSVHYKKGDLSRASESLQQALNLIAELSVQSYLALLPEAPKGWTVEENASDQSSLFSGIGGLIVATKRYKKLPAELSVQSGVQSGVRSGVQPKNEPHNKKATTDLSQTAQIALINNLPSFAQMAVNAMAKLRGAKAGADVFVIAGYQGSVVCDNKGKCEVMMQLGDKAIVTAESQNIPKKELLALLRKIKLDKFTITQ